MPLICAREYARQCDAYHCERYGYYLNITDYSIFLNGDQLDEFIEQTQRFWEKVGEPIKKKFVIHNTDHSFGYAELTQLLPYADSIKAINCTIEHDIVEAIPLGVSDNQYDYILAHPELKPNEKKEIFIYSNFSIRTNVNKRAECIRAEIKNRTISIPTHTQHEYYYDLCRSKYVLCPEGTGMDTHRVYESLYYGAIPIVKRNALAPMYERIGGIIIVDEWEECNNLK